MDRGTMGSRYTDGACIISISSEMLVGGSTSRGPLRLYSPEKIVRLPHARAQSINVVGASIFSRGGYVRSPGPRAPSLVGRAVEAEHALHDLWSYADLGPKSRFRPTESLRKT